MADHPFEQTNGEAIGAFGATSHLGFSPFIGAVANAPDTTGPVVTLISPAEGTIESDDLIHVTVTDAIGLARCILGVRLSIGTSDEKFEFIHDGDVFAIGYTFSPNVRTAISGGFDYVLSRRDGWPSGSMKFKVYSFDTDGNEDED